MGMLRKEWTEDEINKLTRDIKAAKVKVFAEWGFTNTEIAKILDLPESVIRVMLNT